ncbi:gustatory and odorant receptor 22-like [Periplaneta americana]|uniref:gustatory and odorant receptor 22-like n=1 Tax=Periplaneta americana TaxID=6978 RepID=UPI0037E71D68
MSCTLGFYILCMFLTLTFFVYHTSINLVQHRAEMSFTIFECGIMAFVLFVVCDSANKATLSIGDRFRDGILTARLSANDMYVKEQLDLFLTVISTNPPRLSLGGFVIVNRALYVSLGSMMATYLIVLLQFNLSSNEDTHLYNISLQI